MRDSTTQPAFVSCAHRLKSCVPSVLRGITNCVMRRAPAGPNRTGDEYVRVNDIAVAIDRTVMFVAMHAREQEWLRACALGCGQDELFRLIESFAEMIDPDGTSKCRLRERSIRIDAARSVLAGGEYEEPRMDDVAIAECDGLR